ncbi:VOC family protein [Macrococcus equi]|uniref:VOC family protein n=1 Tax=Macrococcus equi TaxID=3395462 RepID=UPI0039BE2A79
MKLSLLSIGAKDMDESLKFYTEVLDLEIKTKDYYPEIVELNSLVPIVLYKVNQASIVNNYEQATLLIDFEVDDLDSTKRKLLSHNIEYIFKENQQFPGGIMNAIKDPNGNIIELLEFQSE